MFPGNRIWIGVSVFCLPRLDVVGRGQVARLSSFTLRSSSMDRAPFKTRPLRFEWESTIPTIAALDRTTCLFRHPVHHLRAIHAQRAIIVEHQPGAKFTVRRDQLRQSAQ